MKRKLSRYSRLRLVALILAIGFTLAGIIPVRIAIALHQAPVPQTILVLGGSFDRTKFAAKFWLFHQNLDIWVSDSPEHLNEHYNILQEYGVPRKQLRLDGRATDTVTNFTSLVMDFTKLGLQHIYLVTSDSHMRRSRAIAIIVLGSRGIVVTPLAVPSTGVKSESLVRVLRDCGRSVLWVVSGKTGASLNPNL